MAIKEREIMVNLSKVNANAKFHVYRIMKKATEYAARGLVSFEYTINSNEGISYHSVMNEVSETTKDTVNGELLISTINEDVMKFTIYVDPLS